MNIKQSNSPSLSVGFVGWNPFQLLHVRNLISSIEGACFVLEDRGSNIAEFRAADLTDPSVPILVAKRNQVHELDGVFDILVFQTAFASIHLVKQSKIAMLQYGYAKEAHNYGAWRSFAELNLSFGPYATHKIEKFSPAVSVGNPRYDSWHDDQWKENARARILSGVSTDLPTVLYAPTWGDLSSIEKYLAAVTELSKHYNVLLKLHHNTDILEKEKDRRSTATEGGLLSFGASDDLLELLASSDVVISDYSGAIFDAIYCDKPVVLLNSVLDEAGLKVDRHSIEYARRNELGYEVDEPSDVLEAVQSALSRGVKDSTVAVKSELFLEGRGAVGRAVEQLLRLRDGHFERTQSQEYIHREMCTQYDLREKLKTATSKKTKAGPK